MGRKDKISERILHEEIDPQESIYNGTDLIFNVQMHKNHRARRKNSISKKIDISTARTNN